MALDDTNDPYFTPDPAPRPRGVMNYDPDTALSLISKYESGDRNIPNYRFDPTHTAQGHYQITNTNWRNLGPQAGVDLKQYPSAMAAPKETQKAVAKLMYNRRGFADWAPFNPRLKQAVQQGEQPATTQRVDPYFTPETQTPKQTAAPQQTADPYFTPEVETLVPVTPSAQVSTAPTPVPTVTVPVAKARRPDQLTSRIAQQLSPPKGKTVDNSMLVQPSARSVLGIAPPVGQQIGELTQETAPAYEPPPKVKEVKVLPGEMYAPPEKENVADQQWRQAHEPEIAAQTEAMRKVIREQGGPKWVNEGAAKGVAGWASQAAGIQPWMINPALGLASAVLGMNSKGGADKMRVMAEATRRAAEAEGADRSSASKFAQNLLGGTIASAPALAAMSAGVPAPVAFGAQGGLEALGQGGTAGQAIAGTASGAKRGLGWEAVPSPAGIIPKMATVGVGQGAIAVGEHKPLGEVAQESVTNALLAGAGEFMHSDFGRVKTAENQAGVPDGKIRVTDESGNDHVIIQPSRARNARAVPLKTPTDVAQPAPEEPYQLPPMTPERQAAMQAAPTTPAGGNEPAATSPAEGAPTAPTPEELVNEAKTSPLPVQGSERQGVESTPTLLRAKDGERGGIIAPSPTESGKWRLTRFDSRGFSGHGEYNSRADALRSAEKEWQFTEPMNESEFVDLSSSEKFAAGNELSQYVNKKNLTPEDNARIAELNRILSPKPKVDLPPEVVEQHRAPYRGITYDFGATDRNAGSPKGLEALRSWPTAQLEKESHEMLRGSFDRMFGRAAESAKKLVDKVLAERKLIETAEQPSTSDVLENPNLGMSAGNKTETGVTAPKPEGARTKTPPFDADRYARVVLGKNPISLNELDYYAGRTGKDPHGIPDEVWRRAFAEKFNDITVYKGATKDLREEYLGKITDNPALAAKYKGAPTEVAKPLSEGGKEPATPPVETKPSPELPTTRVLDGKTYTRKGNDWFNDAGRRVGGIVAQKLSGQAGAIDVDLLTLGVRPFAKEVAEKGRAGIRGIADISDGIKSLLAPATRGPEARTTAAITRANASEMARAHDIAEKSLSGAQKYFAGQKPQNNYDFIDRMERGQQQPDPNTQKFADALRTMLDQRRDQIRALGTGKLDNFIENYFPHIWKDPEKARDAFAQAFGRRPLEGSKAFLKQRKIPLTSEGLSYGLEPVSNNPVDLTNLKLREMDKYLMAHKIMGELQENGLRSFLKSSQRTPEGYADINDKVATVFGRSKQGELVLRGRYVAPEPAAKILNNYLSPGLEGTALRVPFKAWRASANLLNQAQLGWSAYHAGFTTLDAAISRFSVGLEDIFRYGKFGRAAKTFASVPVSPITNLIKGSKMLSEWYKPGSQGAEIGKMVDAMVQSGGRAKMDRFYTNSASKRFMDTLRQGNPILAGFRLPAAAMEKAAAPIMEWLVPRQKAGIFAEMAKRELERLGPNASREEVRTSLAKAWDSVDNRMGQMVYDNIFWNKVMKDLAMSSVRSVGWNTGTAREVGGGSAEYAMLPKRALERGRTEPLFTHKMAYTASLPIMVGAIGAMTQYLLTGKGPDKLKDYFFPKTGLEDENGNPERISFPSYMKDIYHFKEEPGKVITSKAHPLISLVGEMLSNQDYYGTKIRNEDDPLVQQVKDSAKHVGEAFVPFSVRGYQREKERGATGIKKALPFVGITPAPGYINKSEAAKLMSERMKAQIPSGTRTKEEAARSQLRYSLQSRIRKGEDVSEEIKQDVQSGLLKPLDAKNIPRDAESTRRQLQFKRLGLKDALDVYGKMTADEQGEVREIMETKANSLLNSDSVTDEQREKLQQQIDDLGIKPSGRRLRVPRGLRRPTSAFRQRFIGAK